MNKGKSRKQNDETDSQFPNADNPSSTRLLSNKSDRARTRRRRDVLVSGSGSFPNSDAGVDESVVRRSVVVR